MPRPGLVHGESAARASRRPFAETSPTPRIVQRETFAPMWPSAPPSRSVASMSNAAVSPSIVSCTPNRRASRPMSSPALNGAQRGRAWRRANRHASGRADPFEERISSASNPAPLDPTRRTATLACARSPLRDSAASTFRSVVDGSEIDDRPVRIDRGDRGRARPATVTRMFGGAPDTVARIGLHPHRADSEIVRRVASAIDDAGPRSSPDAAVADGRCGRPSCAEPCEIAAPCASTAASTWREPMSNVP